MSIQIQKSVYPVGPNWAFREFPEAAGQSFLVGETVVLVGGKVTVVASDATLLAGIVMEPASGVTNDSRLVAVPLVGARMISSVFHSTPASAITAVAQVGTRYGLKVVSNRHYIDIEDTSNLAFLLTNHVFRMGSVIGDQWGLAEFEFLDEVNQLSGRDNA